MNEEATIVKLTLPNLKNMSVGMFRDLLRAIHSIDDKCVLCGVAYLTTNEFPESEYYDDTFNLPDKDKAGKKPIDYTLLLPKAALFDKFGFKEVYNSYCSSNFIFPNNIGNKILDYWDLDN